MPDPVTDAMAQLKPEKQSIREEWLKLVSGANADATGQSEPLYLTLAGAGGHDVKMLVDAGIVALEENARTIAQKDQWKVAAVEYKGASFDSIEDEFPGLRVINGRVEEVFHAGVDPIDEMTKYDGVAPSRALVVNLDLNGSVEAAMEGGVLSCPLVEVVDQLARTHAAETPVDWWLCLTFNATINWSEEVESHFKKLVVDAGEEFDDFKNGVEKLLGEALMDEFRKVDEYTPLKDSGCDEMQRSVQVVVPTRVIDGCYANHWRITVQDSLRYVGAKGAPMATWIIRFERSLAVKDEEHDENREYSLSTVASATGSIDTDGNIHLDD